MQSSWAELTPSSRHKSHNRSGPFNKSLSGGLNGVYHGEIGDIDNGTWAAGAEAIGY